MVWPSQSLFRQLCCSIKLSDISVYWKWFRIWLTMVVYTRDSPIKNFLLRSTWIPRVSSDCVLLLVSQQWKITSDTYTPFFVMYCTWQRLPPQPPTKVVPSKFLFLFVARFYYAMLITWEIWQTAEIFCLSTTVTVKSLDRSKLCQRI
jgi:hypothetical protein